MKFLKPVAKPAQSIPVTTPAAPQESVTLVEPLMTEKEVISLLKISRTSLWRMRERNEFPQPVRISPNANRYRAADVRQHMEQGVRPAAVSNKKG